MDILLKGKNIDIYSYGFDKGLYRNRIVKSPIVYDIIQDNKDVALINWKEFEIGKENEKVLQFNIRPDKSEVLAAINGNLKRKDFHWITYFESLDGFETSGTVNISGTNINVTTAATADSVSYIRKKPAIGTASVQLSWDKDRRLDTTITVNSTTAQDIYIISGYEWGNGIGFYIENNELYGWRGGGFGTVSHILGYLGTDYTGNIHLTAELIAGKKVIFYVNGEKKAESKRNYPSEDPGGAYFPIGDDYAHWLINFRVKTTEDAAKEISLSYVDVWQSS
ncbi:hypothetical protein DRJ17_05520 [Candidatus Woesearchaeota archaeon]|nr:MAG: hypothetical protein DRJ17_05520 [Candidatus Woesearchaeota archaeon]